MPIYFPCYVVVDRTKIVKAERKRELVPIFPRRILFKTRSKIVKGEGNRAGLHVKIAELHSTFLRRWKFLRTSFSGNILCWRFPVYECKVAGMGICRKLYRPLHKWSGRYNTSLEAKSPFSYGLSGLGRQQD